MLCYVWLSFEWGWLMILVWPCKLGFREQNSINLWFWTVFMLRIANNRLSEEELFACRCSQGRHYNLHDVQLGLDWLLLCDNVYCALYYNVPCFLRTLSYRCHQEDVMWVRRNGQQLSPSDLRLYCHRKLFHLQFSFWSCSVKRTTFVLTNTPRSCHLICIS